MRPHACAPWFVDWITAKLKDCRGAALALCEEWTAAEFPATDNTKAVDYGIEMLNGFRCGTCGLSFLWGPPYTFASVTKDGRRCVRCHQDAKQGLEPAEVEDYSAHLEMSIERLRDAQQAGYKAYDQGWRRTQCPHRPGTALHAAWLRGYQQSARDSHPGGE